MKIERTANAATQINATADAMHVDVAKQQKLLYMLSDKLYANKFKSIIRERTVSELKLRGFRFNLSENKGIVHLDHGTTLALATRKWSGPSGRGVGLTSLARHHESLRHTRPD